MANIRTIYKRIFAGILSTITAISIITIAPQNVKADVSWPSGPEIQGASAIVMDINSGAILYEKNVHEKRYPASITKILTTLLGIEECELDEKVFFSHDAVFKNEGATSHIAREWREELSVKSTLYAIMLESANECAYALAEHVATKYDQKYDYFVDLMNARAAQLGCTDTHFNNANGLPDEDHYTSAYDMALIAAEAYRNETFRLIAGTKTYTITDSNLDRDDYVCYNHHLMMRKSSKNYYEYVTGGKTGYTEAAGNTLVSYAEKGGMTLVCVVMKDPEVAYNDTKKLLDYCFENYTVHYVEDSDEKILSQMILNTGILNNNSPYVGFGESSYIILPVTADFADTNVEILEGDGKKTIATFEYKYGEHIVGQLKLIKNGASVSESFFQKEEVEEDENLRIIHIKPIYIFVGVVSLLLLGFIIYYIGLIRKNFYMVRHQMNVRREARRRERSAKQSRKRAKRTNLRFK